MKKIIVLMTVIILTIIIASPVGMAESARRGLWNITIINSTGWVAILIITDIYGVNLFSPNVRVEAYSQVTVNLPGGSCVHKMIGQMENDELNSIVFFKPYPLYFLACDLPYCGNSTVTITNSASRYFVLTKQLQ